MTFVKYALPVPDHEHLGRGMGNLEFFGDLVGNVAKGDEVEVIKVHCLALLRGFQAMFGGAADRTARTVFENDLGFGFGAFHQGV